MLDFNYKNGNKRESEDRREPDFRPNAESFICYM